MKKVLIYHKRSSLSLGGDCFLLLTFIAELQKTCDVTLALDFDFGLDRAARTFGVPFDRGRLKVVEIDPLIGLGARIEALRPFCRIRQLKRLAKSADVCISTVNVFDFGRPAHQFICILSGLEGKAFYDYVMNVKTRTGVKKLLRKIDTCLHERILKPLLGVRPTRKIITDPRERIYPTSRYVENVMRGYFGAFNGEVFYPPTTAVFADRDVPRDPLKVVHIGRIFAPKRLTDIIDIVELVRKLSGKDLTLDIAGELDESPYANLLKKMAGQRPWLALKGPRYGRDKERFLLAGSYAIQAERDETFGICITEYLKAGIVPLVPDSGGPREIVDTPALTYRTNDEAAGILARLLQDAGFREEQRRRCAERAEEFAYAAYRTRQRKLLSQIVEAPQTEPASQGS